MSFQPQTSFTTSVRADFLLLRHSSYLVALKIFFMIHLQMSEWSSLITLQNDYIYCLCKGKHYFWCLKLMICWSCCEFWSCSDIQNCPYSKWMSLSFNSDSVCCLGYSSWIWYWSYCRFAYFELCYFAFLRLILCCFFLFAYCLLQHFCFSWKDFGCCSKHLHYYKTIYLHYTTTSYSLNDLYWTWSLPMAPGLPAKSNLKRHLLISKK